MLDRERKLRLRQQQHPISQNGRRKGRTRMFQHRQRRSLQWERTAMRVTRRMARPRTLLRMVWHLRSEEEKGHISRKSQSKGSPCARTMLPRRQPRTPVGQSRETQLESMAPLMAGLPAHSSSSSSSGLREALGRSAYRACALRKQSGKRKKRPGRSSKGSINRSLLLLSKTAEESQALEWPRRLPIL